MERTGLSPHKELVEPNKSLNVDTYGNYPKPTWMLNESVSDTIWEVGKTGHVLEAYKIEPNNIYFSRQVSHCELLTDECNKHLLEDIRNSILYLNTKGKISRAERAADILNSACHLIFHVNEIQELKKMPPIRSLAEIRFSHIKSYLLSFKVEIADFTKSLEILKNYNCKSDVDWSLLKRRLELNTRQFESLKDKLTKYFENNNEHFHSNNGYIRKYPSAGVGKFDACYDLAPSSKTISNEISKINSLHTARPSQRYKFEHDVQRQFSGGNAIFDEMVQSEKTLLMPAHIAFHTLSSSLQFVRAYGPSIREYVTSLNKIERKITCKCTHRERRENFRNHQKAAFEITPIPDPLKGLNIIDWRYDEDNINTNDFSNGISVSILVRLYIAAMWILISIFSSARTSSIITLKRSCFVQSPVDGLFDLVLRIPKSSERWELEEVNRPIPDLIFDYGLEFAAFISEIEERRGILRNDDDAYLFPRTINTRSTMASLYNKKVSKHEKTLSIDTLYRYLDTFFDWIESPLIDGKRWYARTHQFRRFTAVLYFNLSDGKGLDELSWFLGHANLDQTFHYAEVSPTAEWIEEAERTIAKIGASLDKKIRSDEVIQAIVDKARNISNVRTILEPLVQSLISEHKEKTQQEVRFCRIDNQEVFFYFFDKNGD